MFERQNVKNCIYKQQRITHVSHAKTTKVSRYFFLTFINLQNGW